jgi:hypothetical protein
MTPRMYWIGWAIMGTALTVLLIGVGWYLGAKLDAILEVLRGR